MVEEREEGSHRSAWQYPIKYGYRPDAGAALPRLRRAGLAGLDLVFLGRRGRQEPRRRRMQHDESIRIDSLGIPFPRDDHGGVLAQGFSDREAGGGEGNDAQGRCEDEAFHGVLLSSCVNTATPPLSPPPVTTPCQSRVAVFQSKQSGPLFPQHQSRKKSPPDGRGAQGEADPPGFARKKVPHRRAGGSHQDNNEPIKQNDLKPSSTEVEHAGQYQRKN